MAPDTHRNDVQACERALLPWMRRFRMKPATCHSVTLLNWVGVLARDRNQLVLQFINKTVGVFSVHIGQ